MSALGHVVNYKFHVLLFLVKSFHSKENSMSLLFELILRTFFPSFVFLKSIKSFFGVENILRICSKSRVYFDNFHLFFIEIIFKK